MKRFNYVKAKTTAEASEKLIKENAVIMAGGTDLVSCLKDKIVATYPDTVISLKGIDGLKYIESQQGKLKIGAMTTLAEIASSKIVEDHCKALGEAAYSVASPNIRNSATLGGNLCQDTRCWYYRYPDAVGGKVDCARKTGEVCYAMMGENRYHSIFGGVHVTTSACTNACPAGTRISAYLEEMRKGNVDTAARIIMEVNPMPFITSRVCAHFCQESCGRGGFDESVNIGAIERHVGDHILDNYKDYMVGPDAENGKKIAIVGSGPAGLTAAFYLRKEGYKVTLFERMGEAGGCLTYAIPAYRLPKEIVRKFVSALEEMGIEFKVNTNIGEDGITLDELYESHDSVMLDTGTWKRPLIGIAGEEMTRFGLDFLVDVNNYIHERPGSNVVVVGGGNVAVDVAITAKRLGAPHVSMVCLESREEMPANSEEVERVIEEGVELLNGWGPNHVERKDDHNVSGIEFKRCTRVFGEDGRFSPQYDESDLKIIDADVILMAIGQVADLDFLKGAFQVETERGRIKAIDGNRTSIDGIFAAGDVTTGPATVIAAVAAGKDTASLIKEYTGHGVLDTTYSGGNPQASNTFTTFSPGCRDCKGAKQLEGLALEERSLEKEDFGRFAFADARDEAERCLNCGCLAVNPSDMANMLVALGAEVRTNMRTISAEELMCNSTRIKETLKEGEILLEIIVPEIKANTVAHYEKFRYRKSIDFAVAGLATSYTLSEGKIIDARIVLGACAPVPVRAKAAEEFLIGKAPSEEVAAEAGELALADAIPLENNSYKIELAKTLIGQSIRSL